MDDLLLGIDVGTTATKAALFTPDGTLRAVSEYEYPLRHVGPSRVEQHPDDWWTAVCSAVRDSLSQVTHGAERVAALTVSSQGPTLLALDAAGEPLRPCLIWMDRRAEAEARELEAEFGAETIFNITGNRPDTLYTAAKLRWLRHHEPDVLRRTHQFMQVCGYVVYRLTGAYSLDMANAALLQLRDYASGEWWGDMLEACGVNAAQFPPVLPADHVLGGVTHAAADATGLRPGTPVTVGTLDVGAAALEAGAVDPGIVAEMTGTSTVLIMPNLTGETHPMFVALPHAITGFHTLVGSTNASGASLRWYRDQFGRIEQRAGEQLQVDPYDLITLQAAQIDPGSDGVIFLPYMMGERTPIWHTNARGVFFGLSLATPRPALARAILEGTAFGLRHIVETAATLDVQFTEIRAVGGGSRSALWNQIKADILGVPIVLPAASTGAAFGDALLAGLGASLYSDIHAVLNYVVTLRVRHEPDMNNHRRYSDIYPIFRSLYEHLRDDFDVLADIVSRS